MTLSARCRRWSAFAFLALLTLAAGAREPEAPWSRVIEGEGGQAAVFRSPADDRQYRFIELANGMKVLLIADATADKGAAALTVHVGSFANPAERQGLAHFLEHMLFLGTEKYPEAGAYQAYISAHGGTNNAFTSLEDTSYFFDVSAPHLVAALDRFAQFFVAPRFDAAYVDRERHAVDAEYRLKIKDDARREWDVLSELVNPAHPLAGFSVGALDTLADRPGRPVRDDLLRFYRAHYSAERMTLVVLGRESLADLEAAVRSRFGAVPKRRDQPRPIPVPLFADAQPRQVFIKPDQEKRELSLVFPVPSARAHWRTQPGEVLGYLLGDESPGSLLASLKAQGLAEKLSAGMAFDTDVGAAFNVSLTLTPAGVAQVDEVLRQTFAWLALVRAAGVDAWRYRELARLQHIHFRFLDRVPAINYVQQLSAALQRYPAAEVLRGPYLLTTFDAGLIRQYADLLVPERAFISLLAPEVGTTDRVSKRYRAPYRVAAVSDDTLAHWRAAGDDRLRLPAPNPYIPDQFPLGGKGDAAAVPELLRQDPRATLWYYWDTRFGTPRAQFVARLALPEIETPAQVAMTEWYLAVVRDQLNAEVYPAQLAGLDFEIKRWSNGVALTLNGYADKQPVLLAKLLATLADPDREAARVARVQAMLVRDWRNSARQWPIKQVVDELPPLVTDSYRALDLAAALAPLTGDDLDRHVARLYARGHAQFYVGGALPLAAATTMADQVLHDLRLGAEGDRDQYARVLTLAPAVHSPRHSIKVDHHDSGALLYVQGRTTSLRERAHFAVLQSALEAPFYNELRTEKQLGYAVGSSIMPLLKVPGMIFYVQSPVLKTAPLMAEIDGFLARAEHRIAALSDAELARHRQAVLTGIEEAPKSLAELAARHQEALQLDFTAFDFRARLAREVRAVTRASLLAAYREAALGARRALWVTTADETTDGAGLDRAGLVTQSTGYYLFPQ